jgi:hypothetical protein
MRRSFLVLTALWAGCSTDELGPSTPDAAVDARVTPDARERPDAAPVVDAPEAIDAAEADAAPDPDGQVGADASGGGDAAPGPDAAPAPDAGPLSCLDEGTEVVTSTIFFTQTFTGATDTYSFQSNQCSDPPDSAERIYGFEVTSPIEWYAETRCGTSSGWDCELVLTKDGCADPDVVACETTIGDEVMSSVLQPGRYALFLEGDNPEDPAVYDFMVNFHHTGGQAQCEATTLDVIEAANCRDPALESPHYRLLLEDITTPEDVDDFFVEGVDGCDHDQDHVGGAPDRVYRLELPEEREVSVVLAPDDWDGMLYVTRAPCGARDAVVACSDDLTGSEEEIDETLAAGTWYIVVDGFGEKTFDSNAWGTFSLEVKVYDDFCDE